MKFLVIHTGGTISSEINDNTISATDSSPVVSEFIKINGQSFEFSEEKLSSVLSENIDDNYYARLINFLNSLNTQSFDGIIILHGTDTLSYTSSIVSMALRHFKVPVAFVSSNYIMSDYRSNALDNFSMAVSYFACGGKGFVVPYKNSDGRQLIHLATRITEADNINDNFESLGNIPVVELVKNYIVSYEDKIKISNSELETPKTRIINKEIKFDNKIMLIKAYPGIDYSFYSFKKSKPCAILHTAYHSGTANSNKLPDFIKECGENNIDFYLCPVKRNEEQYETTKKLIESGAQPLYNMTVESALAKLKLKYNLDNTDMEQNLYYEEFDGGKA